MLVTNYDHYHDLKPKDVEEFILNQRLMKVVKHRKRKSHIIEKQEVLSIEYKVSKLMADNSMSKFCQNLVANNLKDAYFQEVFDLILHLLKKKYPSRLEDTLDKVKSNLRLHKEIEEMNSQKKYEFFKRFS